MKSIISLCLICSLAFCANSQEFNPILDAKGYMLHFFAVSDNIEIPDSLVALIGDTLLISWHQPKTDDIQGKPLPAFLNHSDTVSYWTANDSSLYRYIQAGNDTSIWIERSVELWGGIWELAITCFDHANNISQYSKPFRFKIYSIPDQPYEVNVIIKRRR